MTSVWAHRGCTEPAAENTVEAFLEAARLGADGVELDVRRSADAALVVHHDAAIPGVGPVCDTVVRDLPGQVPLLTAALAACEGLVVNIEIKNSPDEPGYDPDEEVARMVAELVADGDLFDRVIVSSFQTATLDAVRGADPRVPVGWLLGLAADVPDALECAAAAGYQALHPFVTQVGQALADRAEQLGLALNVWTVNADDDLRAVKALGVDAVITDRTAAALEIVRGR